jgi:hypothetical protein
VQKTALLLVLFALVITAGCVPTAPLVLTPEAQRIQVGQADPGQGYLVIQGIDAIDGSGCGAFGSRGTFNGALLQLRYDAALVHADYIKIISTKEPYGDQHCFHNEYSISAIAYKKTDAAGTP